MDGTLEIRLRGEQLLLHPGRAILWPARASLLVADTHFGKDDVFRRAGVALPHGPALTDLHRLAELIRRWACERLIILGDFLHDATRDGDSFPEAFAPWRRAHAQLSIDVIAGNHDRREKAALWEPHLRWHRQTLHDPPFVFAHAPQESSDGFVMAGHLHPMLRVPRRLGGGRVPVFWRRAGHLVLPSFGSLTGGMNIRAEPSDQLYLAAPERVMSVQLKELY